MNKFCLSILMMLGIFSCQAELIQVSEMKEVFEYLQEADSKTLVIFDIDMVLVQPSEPAFQMANIKKFAAISKRILKEIPVEKQMLFLSLMTIRSHPVLIEEGIPELLQKFMLKGVPTMALTANLTGSLGTIETMERWRVNSLCNLGIDFSKNVPYSFPFVLDDLPSYRGNYSTYLDGILFVNGNTVSKGEALLSFLAKTHLSPDKIIFIDDREDNLKSMSDALQTLGKHIKFLGLHFLGAQKYPSKAISEEEFESRWLTLANETKELN